MTKARTLADFISDGSPLADGTISVSEVSGAAPLASPTFTGATTISSGTLSVTSSTGIGLGAATPAQFGAGVPTIVFQGISDNGRGGAINFREYAASGDGAITSQIYSTDGDDGYGFVFNAQQGSIKLNAGGLTSTKLEVTTSGVVINEVGADNDFRVESDTNTHALFVDAGNNRVAIGSTGYTSTSDLNLRGKGLSIKNDLNGNGDNWSVIQNDGISSTANLKFGTGNGSMELTHGAGLIVSPNLDGYHSVFNETSKDCDFRVESDGVSSMLLVDAGNNSVAINRSYGIAPLHVSGTANDTVSAANAYAKITAQGLDGLAFGSISSGPFSAWIQSGYTANGYSPEMNNGYPLALNPLNANVVIGATNVADSADGLSIISSSRDNLSIKYTGTDGGHASSINFRDKRGATNARINNNLQDDGVGTAGSHLEFYTAVGGTLSERLVLGGTNQTEAVFNDPGYNYDFRVESDNNSNMFVVDAGADRVQIGSQIFGAGQTVSRGEFINFNTGMITVSSGGSQTVNMFTRLPNSEVGATGTVYISAENSGGSIQVGCIIDFFFSNGTLNTTARETGSSQGTMTFSVQENGSAISVTVAYSGGLGGAIRFNAGGHASIASY